MARSKAAVVGNTLKKLIWETCRSCLGSCWSDWMPAGFVSSAQARWVCCSHRSPWLHVVPGRGRGFTLALAAGLGCAGATLCPICCPAMPGCPGFATLLLTGLLGDLAVPPWPVTKAWLRDLVPCLSFPGAVGDADVGAVYTEDFPWKDGFLGCTSGTARSPKEGPFCLPLFLPRLQQVQFAHLNTPKFGNMVLGHISN